MVDYKKIRRIMKEQHIFIKDLAERTGIPYKTMLWQFKTESDIKVSMLMKICRVLNIDIKDILL